MVGRINLHNLFDIRDDILKKLLALLLLSPLIFIASYGKTPEQKAEIAIISCNILEASLDTDASQRIIKLRFSYVFSKLPK